VKVVNVFALAPAGISLSLNGLDDIGQTLQHDTQIAGYETARRTAQPWLPTTL